MTLLVDFDTFVDCDTNVNFDTLLLFVIVYSIDIDGNYTARFRHAISARKSHCTVVVFTNRDIFIYTLWKIIISQHAPGLAGLRELIRRPDGRMAGWPAGWPAVGHFILILIGYDY
jgi:hypothetical protein